MPAKKSADNFILISTKTVFIVVAAAILLWLLIQIKEVVLLLFVSLMLSLALTPFVDHMERKKISRGVSVLLIYLILIVAIGAISAVIFPPILTQTTKFVESMPRILEAAGQIPFLNKVTTDLNNFLAEEVIGASGNVIKVTVGAFSSIVSIISLLVFTAYLLLDFENLKEAVLYFLPPKPRSETKKVLIEIEHKLGAWLRGQFFLMLIIGVTTYLGLLLLGVEYAVPLAVIAGLFEIVPILGPFVSAIPAVIVGFSMSPIVGFGVLAWYLGIQQLENNFILPKVMQKAVGFNPLITLLALLVGGKLFGIVGALLSVPITLIVSIVIKHVLEYD